MDLTAKFSIPCFNQFSWDLINTWQFECLYFSIDISNLKHYAQPLVALLYRVIEKDGRDLKPL